MTNHCDNLDSFLAGDLPPDAGNRFATHLAECDACRQAVDQQRWIDGLLSSPIRHELELAPAGVAESVRAAIVQRRRQVRLGAGGLAAAAAIVVAAGWTALWERSVDRVTEQRAVALSGEPEPSPHPSLRGRGIDLPRAVFVGGPDVIVVPVETHHPNVTVLRVYPTYQPTYAAQARADLIDADGRAWAEDLNGG